MGLAASQARLLSLTARIHDVEFEAQMLQDAKLKLALMEDDVRKKYLDALDAKTLTFMGANNERVAANFNNLCGLQSINNFKGANSYVFYAQDGALILPSDIHQAYEAFTEANGNMFDPYQFAIYMASGTDSALIGNALTDLDNNLMTSYATDETVANTARTKLIAALKGILGNSYADDNGTEIKDGASIADILAKILQNGLDLSLSSLPEEIQKYCEKSGNKDELNKLCEAYRYKVFMQKSSECCKACGQDPDYFDQDKFNYYLKWAKLIEMEYGHVCGAEEYSGINIEEDAQSLNDLLRMGTISISVVTMNFNNGKISEEYTTPGSDSGSIAWSQKSTVDSTELKKAEAEYNNSLSKIQQQDKRYDLSIKRLETERTALTTEYDSVKKVISDNIERSFGIFS